MKPVGSNACRFCRAVVRINIYADIQPCGGELHIVGEIVNVCVEEGVLDSEGKVDPKKVNAFVFDQFQSGYYAVGEKVGQAWNSGAGLMKK